jgi:serine/threonine protein kinase
MTLAAGSRIGPYEIVSSLGAGGMGEVYRARDTRLKRNVALKILPESFASDPESLARFQREAEALASLNHPNIAQIYELEESRDVVVSGFSRTVRALVMELVEGETLAERLSQTTRHRAHGTSRKGLPIDEAVAIARQIGAALEAAHEKGMMAPTAENERADERAQIIVVQNWFEELKRLVPVN